MLNNINSIFLDFDGTITKTDTVNSFFKTFAAPEWINIEKDWVEGKINSKTCMQMQLDLIKNLTEEKFFNFLDSIEIQDGFIEFCKIAKENDKKITIISDGFDFFIDYILKKEKLDIEFYEQGREYMFFFNIEEDMVTVDIWPEYDEKRKRRCEATYNDMREIFLSFYQSLFQYTEKCIENIGENVVFCEWKRKLNELKLL